MWGSYYITVGRYFTVHNFCEVYTTIVVCVVTGIALFIMGLQSTSTLYDEMAESERLNESITFTTGFNMFDNFMVLTADTLCLHSLEIYGCLLSSLIISFVLVMWASFIIIRSWRKKVLLCTLNP